MGESCYSIITVWETITALMVIKHTELEDYYCIFLHLMIHVQGLTSLKQLKGLGYY